MSSPRTELIQARERHGLSRIQLAGRLGITRQHVMRIELGERSPGHEIMVQWADELHITLDFFRANTPPRHYLREWREARGLSQETLGRLCGTSGATISRYENGERNLRLNLQFKLCQHLGISPGQFFVPPADVLVNAADRNQPQSAA